VGGTINIITKGIESNGGGVVKQEFAWNNDHPNSNIGLPNIGSQKTSFGYNSGLIKNRFGFTLGGSTSSGNGFVDQTGLNAWSYFFKLQLIAGNHLISVGGSGAPQLHQQRSYSQEIAIFDKNYAQKLGV